MTLDSTYHLGCPVFNSKGWLGKLYPAKAPQNDWLHEYAKVFNTVEGNGVFYGMPSRAAVQRWIDATPDGFRFALKFPRAISHEQRLTHATTETKQFLEILEQLAEGNRLGPSFLQLGPRFSGDDFPDLRKYLAGLPTRFPYAVEVRHRDYFDDGPREQALEAALAELGIDRVILDSRPLFSARASDPAEVRSQSRKPKSPIRKVALGKHPMVRLIGRDDVQEVQPWIDEWTPVVAEWIDEGRVPFFFTHTPDDSYCPDLGRMFHASLRRYRPELAPMPAWPGELEKAGGRNQRTLF